MAVAHPLHPFNAAKMDKR